MHFKESCSLNPSLNFKVFNIGIGDTKGKLDFFDEEDFSTTSRFVNSENSSVNGTIRKIPVDTLDNKLGDISGRFIVKIDVEGFEEKVFLGATGLLRDQRLRLIMFERLGRTNLENIRNLLKKYRYVVFFVTPDGSVSFDEKLVSRPLINLFAAPETLISQLK